MKKSNLLMAALGLAVFFFTASQLGWQNIWEQLRRMGWAILLVTVMRTGSQLLFAVAWAWTIPTSARRVPFYDLFRIRLAGEAINYLIPSGTFGGEPLKAKLLSPSIGLANGLAGVAVGKFSQILAQLIVMAAGCLFASFTLNVPSDVKIAMFAVLAVIGVGLAVIYAGQRRGMFGWLAQHLVRLRVGRRFIEPRLDKLRKLDRIIGEIHSGQPGKFAASVAFNALGWLGGAVEMFVVLWLLGTPRSAGTAFVIETMSLIISAALFLVPWQAGTQEAGKALIFGLCGLSPASGFAVGFIQRLRDMAWAGIGLLFLANFRDDDSRPDVPSKSQLRSL
ncbi:MAG: lysylphosphatidylglycerol synthase transmembrane domain-containing protein [Terrimicrobiaceae bacterium]